MPPDFLLAKVIASLLFHKKRGNLLSSIACSGQTQMKKYFEHFSKGLLGVPYNELSETEQDVIESIAESEPIVENVNEIFHEQLTFGQRLADKISVFGGSWTFIIIFLTVLISWIAINSYYLTSPKQAFDPYPYILLNLVLSTIAALQAPIIMMSQNRQASKDRLDITESYKVGLKSELEIMRLHKKIDELAIMLAERTTINRES